VLAVSDLPVLWLCGAPATGKSTVAWHLFGDLAGEGVRAGYVDIDQLGMVYPAPQHDPERHQVKADALAAVLPNYAQAGAQVLVVSGVLDPMTGAGLAQRIPSITFCHLVADEKTIRARLADRPGPTESTDLAMDMLRGLEAASFVAHTIDTTGRTPLDVAREACALIGQQPTAPPPTPRRPIAHGSGRVTVIHGPRAVGKSTVSWELFARNRNSGTTTGYVDLEQLGFYRPGVGSNTPLRVANLAALWETFHTLGVRSLIANGRVDTPEDARLIRETFPAAAVRLVRLAADADAIRRRIAERHRGAPARLIDDDLEGAPPERQDRVLRDSLAEARRFRTADPADEVVDTTNLSVNEVVDLVG
jgi:gluconate kinase